MTIEKLSPETEAINREFETLADALHLFRRMCTRHKSPLRSVSYHVLASGETRCRVTYKKDK